jgi:lipoic acid synthetase
MDRALEILIETPPDVFNHNLETAPRLDKLARPGADYKWSLELLRRFKEAHPEVKTKSGLMVGLGEEISEIEEVLRDLRAHNVDMLTVGQYLHPSFGYFVKTPFLITKSANRTCSSSARRLSVSTIER